MEQHVKQMIDRVRANPMTPEQAEAQRRSFAYGNTNIENPLITRETVDSAAGRLPSSRDERNGFDRT